VLTATDDNRLIAGDWGRAGRPSGMCSTAAVRRGMQRADCLDRGGGRRCVGELRV